MADPPLAPDRALAEFDRQNSPWGLLERYASGRIAHFLSRQILTIAGAWSLFWLASPLQGLIAMALALLGEAVDCLTLRRVAQWRAAGQDIDRVRAVTAFTAWLQALTIGLCVLLAQVGAPSGAASFFALAFLTGAAINAGLVMPFHRAATILRLAVYAATCAIFLLVELLSAPQVAAKHGFDLLGAVMLAYMVKVFLTYVTRYHRRAQRERRELLLGAEALSTANRELEESQRETRQLSLVARHANDSVVISKPDHGILWVNDAFTRTTGYSLQEALGKSPGRLLNGPGTDMAVSARIGTEIRKGRPYRTEILNYTKSGQEIWIETNLVPLLDDAGATDVVIAIERNITETKDHARQLAEAKCRAEDAARAKAAFLATMSHEIRTPMNGIIGMANLLAESALADRHKANVETIRDSAEALLKIINDILDYSRLEANKLTVVQEPFALVACLRSATQLLRPQALDKGLTLDICHDTALPETVMGDAGRLRQIVLNLIGNAIKFTDTGGVTMRVSARPDGPAHHRIEITVRDTGIGIPPDRAARIFDQFEQADADITRKYGGTGLGLAISRHLARGMGGDLVLLTTEPGRHGACFKLTLRLGCGEAMPSDAGAEEVRPPDLAGRSLLVADDNATNRTLIARFLSDAGLQLRFVKDGRAAVEACLDQPPDMVLMDMSMPELDGIAATRAIRAAPIAQPQIIALTANAFASDKAACLAAGMNDFLAKPVRKVELLRALARAAAMGKTLGPSGAHRVSGDPTAKEAPNWTSPPESGTTSGRSTPSSGP